MAQNNPFLCKLFEGSGKIMPNALSLKAKVRAQSNNNSGCVKRAALSLQVEMGVAERPRRRSGHLLQRLKRAACGASGGKVP